MRWHAVAWMVGICWATGALRAAEDGGVDQALALSQKTGRPILAVAGTKT